MRLKVFVPKYINFFRLSKKQTFSWKLVKFFSYFKIYPIKPVQKDREKKIQVSIFLGITVVNFPFREVADIYIYIHTFSCNAPSG